MSKEEAVNLLLQIFSMPENPPPVVTSVRNRMELQSAMAWLRAAKEKANHLPVHRKVKVFKEGPAKTLVDRLLNADYPGNADIDVEEISRLSDEQLNNDEAFEWKYEDEIKNESLEMAFLESPDRVLFLTPEGQVIELHTDSVMAFVDSLERLPGIDEYFDELRKRGIIPKDS